MREVCLTDSHLGAVSSDLLDIQHFSYGTLNSITDATAPPTVNAVTGQTKGVDWVVGVQRDNLSLHRVFTCNTWSAHVHTSTFAP